VIFAPEKNPASSQGQADQAMLPQAGDAIRVLYVEDNRLNALLFEEALRAYPQLLLDIAEDSGDAVQVARNRQPAVLVIDAHLPSMTGYELLPMLRGIPGLETVPAYMCSADASAEDRIKASNAGFNGYWSKPIDIAEVTGELCRLARQKT
jgi:CheY-like chemotaxis protein